MEVKLTNISIKEKIYEGPRTLVYRGIRLSDDQKVVIKLMRNEYPSMGELVQFRNQYAISKNLDLPGIVKSLSLEKYGNGYALVMEDNGGISLDKALANKERIDLETGLKIGIKLGEILHELYQNRIIHKDLKPANILIHPETKEVKLIDFSIASLLPREAQEIQNPNQLEGTLAYISPEQTGRMNRGIDYRSDFYSLGVTLYEILAGKLPFTSDDSMELVHSHIAKMPSALGNGERGTGNRGEAIPGVLSDIVLKLMAKNAEERYQSALGLKFDLEKCLDLWQKTGSIEPFKLGERDLSDRFSIPEKLYGRETEVKTLLDAFARVASGTTEMMLVAGFSGIGKTVVVNEVHKPIVRQRGYFIKGKFDQFQRNIPFSALVLAFRDLMGQLLGESDSQLERWKTRILDALGENSQVIIEVIPELERIIGKQPPAPELSGSAAQNRFNRLFQQFIRVFTTKEHPLVIFVDDLQWADSASLKLMELLMGDTRGGYLLLLGAYRDNEVFPAHPLMLTLDEIAKSGATLNTITLAPLSQKELNRLVADTLSCELELALPLTELVYQKTKGNPFFATQFLNGLHEDGWIEFNPDLGYWECDMTEVRELALSDDVVEFMATRLHKLPEASRELLKLAACIGDRFDLETLAIVSEQSPEETATDLWLALKEGLILPLNQTYKFYQGIEGRDKGDTERGRRGDTETRRHGEGKSPRPRVPASPRPRVFSPASPNSPFPHYKFLHDRVQQAAYSLIPQNNKKATHLKIGELLLNNIAPEEQQQNIFGIVNQLNVAIELIQEVSAKDKLARLNLMAGKKARASAAYQAAYNYLQIGLQVLREESWQEQYELSLSLYEDATEAAYLNGEFERMHELAAIVKQKATTLIDRIKVYEILIQANIAQNLLQEAVQTGLNVVSQLGVNLPAAPTHEELEAMLAEVGDRLRGKALEDLGNLPPMTDTTQLAILRILSSIYAPSFMTTPLLCLLTVAKQVAISIEYGNTPQSAFAYGNYGVILCGILMDIDLGYQFGELALELLEKLNVASFKAKTIMTVNVCVKPWKEPISKTLPGFLEAYTSALEVGDLEFAGYSAVTYCYHSYAAGKQLEVLAKEMATYGGQAYQLKQQLALNNLSPFHQAVLNLQGKGGSDKPWVLLGEIFNEPKSLPSLQKANDSLSLFYFYVNKICLCYLFEAYSEAVEEARLGDRYLNAATASPMVAIFHFYDSLCNLAIYSQARNSEKEVLLSRVAANQEKMLLWAEKAPTNFQHKYDLVEAEKCRVLGQKTEAIELYDSAISGAKENEYIQEEALANELAAKFYFDWGKEKVAAGYMQEAYYCYARWGATAKVEDLEKRYRALLKPILERQALQLAPGITIASLTSGTISKTTTGTGQILDLATLMKAASTLSEDIELKGAIANLMQVARENAGAETVALMLFAEQVLMLTALLAGEDAPKIDPIPVEASNAVPLTVVNQVKHRREALVLDNASKESAFAGDAYIQSSQPKSILCLPLIARGKLIGILYLENNRVVGTFTRDRLELLNLLCSQAAISLENARLYEQSMDYAEKLERYLKELQAAQLQLIQSEKMSALGNLVAGVAHEINNPVGFIAGNLEPTLDYVQELFGLIDLYQRKMPSPDAEIEAEIERIDLEFVRDDLLQIISAMQEGSERLAHISTSLRTFSRTDKEDKVPFKLIDGIESTLLILKHRLKANKERPEIEVERHYEKLPQVRCYPGQLNQVFMNLLANAIDALEEGNAGRSFEEIKAHPNRIAITTCVARPGKFSDSDVADAERQEQKGDRAVVKIADNGVGMPESVKQRIFEHGFTTKGVGKGTGLGMAIALQIVEEKHGGTLTCVSEVGRGTEFIIEIPC